MLLYLQFTLFGIFAGHCDMDLVWPKCVSEFLYDHAILIVFILIIKWFSINCLRGKTNVMTVAIHKACMQSIQAYREQLKLQ